MKDDKPEGIESGKALEIVYGGLPLSAASKLAIVEELLRPPIYDENDNVIGYGEPLISKEEALKLLDAKHAQVKEDK